MGPKLPSAFHEDFFAPVHHHSPVDNMMNAHGSDHFPPATPPAAPAGRLVGSGGVGESPAFGAFSLESSGGRGGPAADNDGRMFPAALYVPKSPPSSESDGGGPLLGGAPPDGVSGHSAGGQHAGGHFLEEATSTSTQHQLQQEQLVGGRADHDFSDSTDLLGAEPRELALSVRNREISAESTDAGEREWTMCYIQNFPNRLSPIVLLNILFLNDYLMNDAQWMELIEVRFML